MEKKIYKNLISKNGGFSLIEILVALGMLGIITTGTMKIIQQQTKRTKNYYDKKRDAKPCFQSKKYSKN